MREEITVILTVARPADEVAASGGYLMACVADHIIATPFAVVGSIGVLKTHRELDMATGEHWYGTRALELQLVDELCTSDDWLLDASKTAELYQVCFKPKKPFIDRLSSLASILEKGHMGRYRSEVGIHEIK